MVSTAIFVPGLLLFALLVLQSVTGQEKTKDSTMDEEAIQQVLATYVATWNTHDMATWGALFTDDVDYVNRGGGWWQSNKANVEGHKVIHDMLVKQKQQMTYTSSVAKIAFLKPDVALVHTTWEWPGFTTWEEDDILDTRLTRQFDLIFDRGCFHVLPPERRQEYVSIVGGLLKTGGHLFLKCFSRLQPEEQGPYRFSPAQIRELFGSRLRVLSIKETVYQGTLDPLPRALFCMMRRA